MQKNRLISIISHDFRDPLTNMSELIGLYADKIITKEEFDELLPSIQNKIETTQELLSNLTGWAKKSLNEFKIVKEHLDLNKTVNEILNSSESKLQEKNIAVEQNIPRGVYMYIDKNTLASVLRNLLSNNIKFCEAHDKISITTKEDNDYRQVCIEDTGTGMNEEQAAKLFKIDVVSVKGTGEEKGSGIGAVLVKEFLEENSGSVWVDYTEIGKGIRICFKVPLNK